MREKNFRDIENDIFVVVMEGDVDRMLDDLRSIRGVPVKVIERALDILIALSLKGYEGRPTGALYLIGDVEGVRRNTSQMIINPFKGWDRVSIMDPKQELTFQAFTQLDGAILIDSRGHARSAGFMIHVKGSKGPDPMENTNDPIPGKGRGTRWRAAKYITSVTSTTALILSHHGDISLFHRGKEIGRMQRRILRLSSERARELFRRSC
ncbi:MAG: diadenylate cyclase [Candidatus Thermoplasmatota archaeon]|nr:diadenylate cyclase [Candidatus Thermoplasmatota archaeon]